MPYNAVVQPAKIGARLITNKVSSGKRVCQLINLTLARVPTGNTRYPARV